VEVEEEVVEEEEYQCKGEEEEQEEEGEPLQRFLQICFDVVSICPRRLGTTGLARGPGRKLGASSYTRKRLSRTPGQQYGASAYMRKRLSHGGRGESLVPAYQRGSISLSLSLSGFLPADDTTPFLHALFAF